MAQAKGTFSPIDPTESEGFAFDFSKDLATGDSIASVVSATLEQVSGTGYDPDPQSKITAGPTLAGTKVTCQLTSLVANVAYQYTVTVRTTLGNILDLWSYVVCVPQ